MLPTKRADQLWLQLRLPAFCDRVEPAVRIRYCQPGSRCWRARRLGKCRSGPRSGSWLEWEDFFQNTVNTRKSLRMLYPRNTTPVSRLNHGRNGQAHDTIEQRTLAKRPNHNREHPNPQRIRLHWSSQPLSHCAEVQSAKIVELYHEIRKEFPRSLWLLGRDGNIKWSS